MHVWLVIRRLRVRPQWGRQHSFVEIDQEIFSMIRRLQVQPQPGGHHSFMEIDQEIFFAVILSLPLIQEEQLLDSG